MCEQDLSDEEREHRPTGPVALVDELVVSLTNGRIYAPAHPRMKSALATLHESIRSMLAQTRGQPLRIGAADGFLFYDQRPLLGATLSAKRLLEPLASLDSGGLAFARETSPEDLETFIRFLGREVGKVEHFKAANQALDQSGCRTIRFLPPFCSASGSWTDVVDATLSSGSHTGQGSGSGSDSSTSDAAGSHTDAGAGGSGDGGSGLLEIGGSRPGLDLDFNVPMRLHQDAVGVLQDFMLRACNGDNVDTTSANGMVEAILKRLAVDSGSMLGQARYEKYDAFTFGHSIRVCYIALNFARHLTTDQRLLQRIGLAGLMHDIGKARVPFDVLHSTGRLSDEERLEMNMHTVHGGQILLETGTADPLAVATAFSHHQNVDGSGYPAAIRAARPSVATMIVKLADVYEALTAVRPYKPRMAPARAYRIMIDMKGHFEPSLLRRFIEINGIYPVGTRVRLSTGEIARVESTTDSPKEPLVIPILDEHGAPLPHREEDRLDLRDKFGRNKISITETVVDQAA